MTRVLETDRPQAAAPNELAELQRLLVYMLTELDRVSGQTGLRYFLTYGTLIGALREGGLISWDVDVDVFVPVEEYETLCGQLDKRLPADLALYSPQTMRGYEHTFARIGFRGIDHKILRLDLYPLSSGPSRQLEQFLYSVFVKLANTAYMLKLVSIEEKVHYGRAKRLITRMAKIPLALISPGLMLYAINRLRMKKFNGSTLADSCGWFGRRQFFDAAWFDGVRAVSIGGQSFPAPVQAESFLAHTYGDFRSPISSEQRKVELEAAEKYYLKPLRKLGVLHQS